MKKRIPRAPGREPLILTRVRNLDKQVVSGGEVVPNFYLTTMRPGRKFLVVSTSNDDTPILAFHGTFDTPTEARNWAHDHIPVRGNRWTIAPVDAPDIEIK